MSYIRDVIDKHIKKYDEVKTGKLNGGLNPPPENIFTKSEVYLIGRAIADEIEGRLCDNFLMPYFYYDVGKGFGKMK